MKPRQNRSPLRALTKLALLLIAINALAVGLSHSMDGVLSSALFPVGAFGVCLSWVLSFTRWRAHRTWGILIAGGLIFIFMQTAGLWLPLFELIRNLRDAGIQLAIHLWNKTPTDFSLLQTSFETFILKAAKLAQNLAAWSRAPSTKNRLALEFVWDIPVFILAAWSEWTLKKRKDALLALAPALALLGYVLYYSGSHPSPLQIEILVLLLLMGLNNWEMYMSEDRGSLSQQKAASDTGMAVSIVSIGLVLAAGFIPSVSVKDLVTKIDESNERTGNYEVAEALGLKVERELPGTYSAPGLPNQHLIGAQPSISRDVVFTVKTSEMPPMPLNELRESQVVIPRHYWRAITYDVYTGSGWATTLTQSEKYAADQYLFDHVPAGYSILDQEIQKTAADDARLFLTGHLISVNRPFKAAWRTPPDALDSFTNSILGADMLGAITKSPAYHAKSSAPLATVDEMRASHQNYPELIREKYLTLPETFPARVGDLALELTVDQTNAYDKAEALEAFLRTYPYTLDVPPPPTDRDIADYFLFDLKTGYCDYYATTMVVMARSVGLPARLVIGYASGSYSLTSATYVVREADAHSWVEIYFSGIGWVEFEPTASEPRIVRPEQPSRQEESPLEIIRLKPGSMSNSLRKYPLITFDRILLILAVMALAPAGWFAYRNHRQRLRFESPIAFIYSQLFRQGEKLAIRSPIHETPAGFARRLVKHIRGIPLDGIARKIISPAPAEIESLTSLYVQAMYSPRPLNASDQRRAEKIWSRLYWRLLLVRVLGKNFPL